MMGRRKAAYSFSFRGASGGAVNATVHSPSGIRNSRPGTRAGRPDKPDRTSVPPPALLRASRSQKSPRPECPLEPPFHFSSLLSFRFPQCVSLRSGLNTLSTWRFNALMTPMRAIMVGPLSSTTRSRASTAACHSSSCCSAFGSAVMYWPASSRVTRRRPPGIGIGSSKGRFQPSLAIGYQDLLDSSLIEFRAFCQCLRKALNRRAVQFQNFLRSPVAGISEGFTLGFSKLVDHVEDFDHV